MTSPYDSEKVAQYFDAFGMQEWERLVQSPVDEVSLHIHAHYLRKHITPGQHVLEIGAGAGRFTQILAGLGARILVADLSHVQLELNRTLSLEHGFHNSITGWQQLDICDLSPLASNTFDCLVAYGGPFSYVLDQRGAALAECIRVLRPGGLILLSVMSLWGTVHRFLDGVLAVPPESNQKITATGDITPETLPGRRGSSMHLFRAKELIAWLEAAGLTVLEASGSSCLSSTWNEKLKEIRSDSATWSELLRMELEAAAEEGGLNAGTHLIAVARKSAPAALDT